MNGFESQVEKDCGQFLCVSDIRTIQVNIGFKCNMSCEHCHLECGPDREELMDWETMIHVIHAADEVRPELVDITGGAPEIHPHFKQFVKILRDNGHYVQVRTNLTALMEPERRDVPQFLKEHKVRIVASLPCYLEENVCKQRGRGVYEKSIEMLQKLNSLGFGRESDLPLYLVYNPGGPFLPPNQTQLEEDYRRELAERFGIRFTGLYALANMPIGRFWKNLKREKKDDEYMELLRNGFNCQTVEGLMCRYQVCIAWDGTLYDCDFNLALDLPVVEGMPKNIGDFDRRLLVKRKIKTGDHCFGCTAGFGSSCSGVISSS